MPEDRGFFGRVWDGVRNTFDGFFSGDTRTEEEVWEDFRESTQGDASDERPSDDTRNTDTQATSTTTQFDTQAAIDQLVAERRRERASDGLFSQSATATIPTDEPITTELAVVDIDQTSSREQLKIEVTHRDTTGEVIEQTVETVDAAQPLVVFDPKTDEATVYQVIERDADGTTYLSVYGTRDVTVAEPTPTLQLPEPEPSTTQTTEPAPPNAALTTRRVATELRVISAPEPRLVESQPTVLEISTRAERGTTLSRMAISVEPNEPLYVTNQETGAEDIYTVAVGANQAVTLMPLDQSAPAVNLRSDVATAVGSAPATFVTREQTTELQLLDVTEQNGTARALLEITQLRDDGEVMDREVRDVGVDTPIEVTNVETGEIDTFTTRRIDARGGGGVTLSAADTGTTYTVTPERSAAVTTRYEVPFTPQETRQRVAYEPPVRVQTENQRLRDGVSGVRQYEGDGLDNLNEQEREGLFNRVMSFFANFFGVGSTEAPEPVTPGSTDPYFPASSS